jgi:hypothetical protein
LLYTAKMLNELGFNLEATVNRKELEMRIWGKSISYGREHGIISNDEATFLLDEYLKEFQSKVQASSANRLFFAVD